MRCYLFFGVLLLAGSTLAAGQEAKKESGGAKAPNYYPLEVDNAWYFKTTVGGNSGDAVWRIVKIDDGKAEKLARLEATVNGNVIATEHLRQTSEGIFRHRLNGVDITPPICLLKYPLKADAKWSGKIAVGSEKGTYTCEANDDAVAVPAGMFKAIRVKIRLEDTNGKTANTTYWFAPDVGMVKQSVENGNTKNLAELQKFERAKDKK